MAISRTNHSKRLNESRRDEDDALEGGGRDVHVDAGRRRPGTRKPKGHRDGFWIFDIRELGFWREIERYGGKLRDMAGKDLSPQIFGGKCISSLVRATSCAIHHPPTKYPAPSHDID
jgi:hypothetical protein